MRCLLLFSGGLDSILAGKVLQDQGVEVVALQFVTPFFGRRGEEADRAAHGFEVHFIDVSEAYLAMLRAPRHGYGKHFNPCIDCKIFMLQRTLERLDAFGASFVATGEVVGQRPMSQRRETLRLIERESGAEGRLLRPLSALYLRQTSMERQGLIDRSRLLDICGRGRKEQIRLAEHYGVRHYPAPSGGCVLADPFLSVRLRRIFDLWPDADAKDCLLAQTGRHFLLPDGSWVVAGRIEEENERLLTLQREGDRVLTLVDRPGPTGLWRRARDMALAPMAAGLLARYAKKGGGPVYARVGGQGAADVEAAVEARLPDDGLLASLRL